jgi:hypothetical protein
MVDQKLTLDELEPLVREAFAAAVARDPERSATALAAMGDQAPEGVLLAVAVDIEALRAEVDGRDATAHQLFQHLALEMATIEEWAQFKAADINNFLLRIYGLPEAQPVDPLLTVRMAFVVGAFLMVSYTPITPWYKYLDKIIQQIEEGSTPN